MTKRENRGGLWKNDRKEHDKQPDLTGNAMFKCPACGQGSEHWVSAWKRRPDENPRAPILNMAFTPKDASQTQSYGGDSAHRSDRRGDDDIPF